MSANDRKTHPIITLGDAELDLLDEYYVLDHTLDQLGQAKQDTFLPEAWDVLTKYRETVAAQLAYQLAEKYKYEGVNE